VAIQAALQDLHGDRFGIADVNNPSVSNADIHFDQTTADTACAVADEELR